MAVELKLVMQKDVAVVYASGDALDASNVQRFRADVASMVDGEKFVLFNFGNLKFVDSSGIGALLSFLRKANAEGGTVKICDLQPNVLSLFELVRLNRIIDIYPTEIEAIRAFPA